MSRKNTEENLAVGRGAVKLTAHDAALIRHIPNFLKSTYMHIISPLGELLIASGPAIVGSF